jgi:very-short-patch-repair endonuclease
VNSQSLILSPAARALFAKANAMGKVAAVLSTNVEYACVMYGKTVVVTDQGLKRIADIRVGDRVLTQAGDYQAVIATNSFRAIEKPDMVDLEVPWRTGKNHKVTVTADHKILAFREGRNKWIMAGELRDTDLLYVRRKTAHNKGTGTSLICQHCQTPFKRRNSKSKYCTDACRRAAWDAGANPHLGKKRSIETRALQGAVVRARLERDPESHPNRVLSKRGHRTEYERAVEEWLVGRGISFEMEKRVGVQFADFYLPAENLIIEADGAFWHQDQARDIARDRRILAKMPGVTIIHLHFFQERFSPKLEKNPLPGVYYVSCNPGPDTFVDPIQFEARPIAALRHWRYGETKTHRNDARRTKLYDLTVENVHSFFANGILVSNSYQEYGTRKMAAHPMVGPYLAEYQAIVEEQLKEAFALHPGDPMQAVTVGIEHAALIILGNIANRAAVDTGRLKNSWTATLPDGRRTTFGPVVTAEQQRAMRKARALASAKRAAGGRTAAKRA